MLLSVVYDSVKSPGLCPGPPATVHRVHLKLSANVGRDNIYIESHIPLNMRSSEFAGERPKCHRKNLVQCKQAAAGHFQLQLCQSNIAVDNSNAMFAPCMSVSTYPISPGEVVALQDVHVDVPRVHVGRLVGGGGGEGQV